MNEWDLWDWELIWMAHNVTRPSRLELKVGMISQWFFTTDSEALCDEITTCRYHHEQLPRTNLPPILSYYLYLMFHASWGLVTLVLSAPRGILRQPVEENHRCFVYCLMQSSFWQA